VRSTTSRCLAVACSSGIRETRALQRGATQNTKPALDLIEPAGVRRREMEMDTRVSSQPPIVLRLHGHVAGADMLFADKHDLHSLHHRVGCLTAPMRPLVSIIPRASNGMQAEL